MHYDPMIAKLVHGLPIARQPWRNLSTAFDSTMWVSWSRVWPWWSLDPLWPSVSVTTDRPLCQPTYFNFPYVTTKLFPMGRISHGSEYSLRLLISARKGKIAGLKLLASALTSVGFNGKFSTQPVDKASNTSVANPLMLFFTRKIIVFSFIHLKEFVAFL